MKKKDEQFLRRVSELYYYEELSQDQIAEKMNVSRTTISRALTQAKKEGYIKIVLDFPMEHYGTLEKQIEEKFGIKEAVVVPTHGELESADEVSDAAARYLARILKHDMVIGLTWGRTMKWLVDAFDRGKFNKNLKVKGVKVVPLLGSSAPSSDRNDFLRLAYSSLLTSKMSELVRGVNYSLPAPMYVKNLELKKLLEEEPEISRTLKKARECQAVFMSIGNLSDLSSVGALSDEIVEELEALKDQGGIGETLGRVFDAEGNAIESEFDQHLVGMSLEDLKQIPTKVCVINDDYKLPATKVALKSGIANVLIISDWCAKLLIEE